MRFVRMAIAGVIFFAAISFVGGRASAGRAEGCLATDSQSCIYRATTEGAILGGEGPWRVDIYRGRRILLYGGLHFRFIAHAIRPGDYVYAWAGSDKDPFSTWPPYKWVGQRHGVVYVGTDVPAIRARAPRPPTVAARSTALPHGCVSATNSYWVSADVARRYGNAAVYTNRPCSFYFTPGDTYSGSGAFIVKCSSGGKINHPDVQGGQYPPVVQQPIPQPCKPGATVSIYANQPFQGGAVVAGSPT